MCNGKPLIGRPSRNVLLVEAGIDTPPGSVPPDILNSYHLSRANPALKWSNFRAYHQPLPHNAPAVRSYNTTAKVK